MHPYTDYEDTRLWKAVEKAIEDLVKNKDLEETMARPYIVGYICKSLDNSSLLSEVARERLRSPEKNRARTKGPPR